ncbi:hypothetical protein P885DRAFT_78889 [Corynascus similis CBS 632.67]
MVTRKPLPQSAELDPAVPRQSQDGWVQSNTEDKAIYGNGTQHHQQQQRITTNLEPSDVPTVLRPGAAAPISNSENEGNIWGEVASALATSNDPSQVPAVLRPGTNPGVKTSTSQGSELSVVAAQVPTVLVPAGGSKPETNPFKRKMSLSASGASQGQPATSPNIPPIPSVPVADFSQLSVSESSTNPWQPALNESKETARPIPRLGEQDSVADNVWGSATPSRQPTPGLGSDSPALVSLPSEEPSAVWDEEPKRQPLPTPLNSTADNEVFDNSNAWDEIMPSDKGKGVAQSSAAPSKGSGGADDWNLIDMEPQPEPLSRQSTWENFNDEDNAAKSAPAVKPPADEAPKLPPRHSQERPLPPLPRPVDESETYQIKNITWHDETAAKNPRVSPILVQNANGPCPLVALVNALTLTTPADKTNTALVDTLRSREQVSLGLLLDAVFDELMSERRVQPDVPLPDVTELYGFLKGLHTGMNVNPRFVPTPEVVAAFKRTSLSHLHPTERIDRIPGTFEHTKEMALYSTFSIPLIHGWLPSKGETVYEAFSRQAASYEDTQNLLFREEELEEKLCSPDQGLTPDEQQIYQDILTIKSFLSISATQLTKFGLEVIKQAMKPGSVAILFRNDHFSTLYRHPQTLELFTLVTDAGYAGHAEVVWESLVDVNGERTEFFSGDFRPVGGAIHTQSGPSGDIVPDAWTDAVDGGNDSWTTVQGRRGRTQTAGQSTSAEPPLSPKHEQEDRDLALALQLQEEEDERARADQERRRRESLLSEQFIEQQGRGDGRQLGGTGRGPVGGRNPSLSTTSLTPSTNSSRTGGRRPTPAQPRLASASTTTQSVNGNISGANASNRPRPTTQTVRSLLPPRTATSNGLNTTPATARMTHRPADEGLDDAPPSYEQAAKQEPYVPPAGHPSHPGSTSAGTSNSTTAAAGGRPQQQQQQGVIGPGGQGGGRGRYFYPGAEGRGGPQPPAGYRRGVPPSAGSPMPVSGGSGRDRDCVVM